MKIVKTKYGTIIEADFSIIGELPPEKPIKWYNRRLKAVYAIPTAILGGLLLGNVFMYIRAICCNLWVKYHGFEVINVVVG